MGSVGYVGFMWVQRLASHHTCGIWVKGTQTNLSVCKNGNRSLREEPKCKSTRRGTEKNETHSLQRNMRRERHTVSAVCPTHNYSHLLQSRLVNEVSCERSIKLHFEYIQPPVSVYRYFLIRHSHSVSHTHCHCLLVLPSY